MLVRDIPPPSQLPAQHFFRFFFFLSVHRYPFKLLDGARHCEDKVSCARTEYNMCWRNFSANSAVVNGCFVSVSIWFFAWSDREGSFCLTKKRKKKRNSSSSARFTEGTQHSDDQLVAESVIFRLHSSWTILWVDGVSTCSYRFVTSTPGITYVGIVVFRMRTYTDFFLGFRSHNTANFDDFIVFMYFFFYRRRLRNIQNFKKRTCWAHRPLNLFFFTKSSLPSPSWIRDL